MANSSVLFSELKSGHCFFQRGGEVAQIRSQELQTRWLFSASITRLNSLNKRTRDMIPSSLYVYYSLRHEMTVFKLSLHHSATLCYAAFGQSIGYGFFLLSRTCCFYLKKRLVTECCCTIRMLHQTGSGKHLRQNCLVPAYEASQS